MLAPIKEHEVSTDERKMTKSGLIEAHMLHPEYNILVYQKSSQLLIPKCKGEFSKKSIFPSTIKLWNELLCEQIIL